MWGCTAIFIIWIPGFVRQPVSRSNYSKTSFCVRGQFAQQSGQPFMDGRRPRQSRRSVSAGVVPREYMMGKGVLVYWAQAFRPRPTMMPVIPNFNTIKVIFGGSEQDY